MPMNAEPADDLEKGLGEALAGFADPRKGLPDFFQFRCLVGLAFLFSLDFGCVFKLFAHSRSARSRLMGNGH